MDRIKTDITGGMPFDLPDLEFMQDTPEKLINYLGRALAKGTNAIIQGCEFVPNDDGVVGRGLVVIGGEVLWHEEQQLTPGITEIWWRKDTSDTNAVHNELGSNVNTWQLNRAVAYENQVSGSVQLSPVEVVHLADFVSSQTAQDTYASVLSGRISTEQSRNNTQDSTLTSHGSRLDSVESKDTAQDGRLDSVESKDTEQDGRLDSVESTNSSQGTTLTSHGTRLDSVESKDTAQDGRLDSVESTNSSQGTTLSRHGIRLNELEEAWQDVPSNQDWSLYQTTFYYSGNNMFFKYRIANDTFELIGTIVASNTSSGMTEISLPAGNGHFQFSVYFSSVSGHDCKLEADGFARTLWVREGTQVIFSNKVPVPNGF